MLLRSIFLPSTNENTYVMITNAKTIQSLVDRWFQEVKAFVCMGVENFKWNIHMYCSNRVIKSSSSNETPSFIIYSWNNLHNWLIFFTYLFFSLSMHVLFPCQNLMNLSAVQQNSFKYLFKKALIGLVPKLSTLNIDNLHLQKASILWLIIRDLEYLRKGKVDARYVAMRNIVT